MTEAEAEVLGGLATGRRVLELGAQYGFSTVLMAAVAESVVSIDWHKGDANAGYQNSWLGFYENLQRYGVADRVIPIVGRCQDALPYLRDGAFELIFHDSSHDLRSVRDDLGAARRLITSGYIAVHDYGRFDGLTRACHATLGRPNQVIGTLAVYRIQ
jgi:predicted O-methyltransferase YrrM